MKTFDWDMCKQIHSKATVTFLKSVEGTDISESEFIKRFKEVPYEGNNRKSRARSANRARWTYKNLRDNFGFFNRSIK